MGLGEGVAPSASTDMVSRVIPNNKRSQATSYIFGGLHAGSLLGLLIAPPLIEQFGWRSVRRDILMHGAQCLLLSYMLPSGACSLPFCTIARLSSTQSSDACQLLCLQM